MNDSVKAGDYYWIKLKGELSMWEPAYRFRAHGSKDVWLVIGTSDNVDDNRVDEIGSRIAVPSE